MIPDNRVFVTGAGRGGTSLLTGLLDAHSAVTMEFEFGAGPFFVDPSEQAAEERLAEFRRECDNLAAQSASPIWGNKITTGQIAFLSDGRYPTDVADVDDPLLEQLFLVHFAGWKVIFVLREGTACVDSKRRRDGLDDDESADRWIYSVRLLRFLQLRHPSLHCVRFEELVHEPERVLQGVCDFLGIAYEDSMLNGTMNPKMRPEYRRGHFERSATLPVEVSPEIAIRIAPAMRLAGYTVGPPR